MADHSKPTVTSAYANFVTELDARLDDLAMGCDPARTSVTNPATDTIRWNSAGKKWEKWSGSAWVVLSAGYAIPIVGGSVDGSPIGASNPNTAAFTRLLVGLATPISFGSLIPVVQQASSSVSGATSLLLHYGGDPAAACSQIFAKSISGGAIATSGALLGRQRWLGHDGAGFVEAARIQCFTDREPSPGVVPGRIGISTAGASGVLAIGFEQDSAQRVIFNSGVVIKPVRSTATSGTTYLTETSCELLLDTASPMASRTITLPSIAVEDGQCITISTRSAITALTINGGTIYGAPSTLPAGGFCSFIYSSSATAWFRKG